MSFSISSVYASYGKDQVNDNYMRWFNPEIIDNCDNGHDSYLPLSSKPSPISSQSNSITYNNNDEEFENEQDEDEEDEEDDDDDDIDLDLDLDLDLGLIDTPFYKSLGSFRSLECLGLIDNDGINDAVIQNLPPQQRLNTIWCI